MTTLTKIDVARRQLVTAIRLLFNGEDSVSVFSLAANSWEIVDVLCTRDDVESLSKQVRGNLPSGKDLKYDYINAPYRNFFKHADRDPDAVVDFDENVAESMVFLAVEDYLRLNRRMPIEMQVYQLWYLAINPEKLSGEAMADLKRPIAQAFPGIADLYRSEQLAMGHRVLMGARNDAELIADPATEASH
ncbi:hypothetical protein [Cupriavidus nantongensis]|uniref:hypothetical protein n=1 Tax=Cupriavidus nantongensis TaxID=1796606 RepID=UPI00358F17E3